MNALQKQKEQALYEPRNRNTALLQLFENEFPLFCDLFDQEFAPQCGYGNLINLSKVVKRYLDCGDYSKGFTRICCTNSACGYEYLRPFSSKYFSF